MTRPTPPTSSSERSQTQLRRPPQKGAEAGQRQRRAQDRRDSPRVPLKLWVRYPNEGAYEECEGNVGLSGVFLLGPVKPSASELELAFWLPQTGEEIRARGTILKSTQVGARIGVHVKLGEMDVRTELALARFLQDWAHNG